MSNIDHKSEDDIRLNAKLNKVSIYIKSIISYILRKLRDALVTVLRLLYHWLPISSYQKIHLQSYFYLKIPCLFRNTISYHIRTAGIEEKKNFEDTENKKFSVKESSNGKEVLCFESYQAPMVSIIIPVYGEMDFTYRCLKSIGLLTPECSYEIIVVNDCSEDDTIEILSQISGIRIIENETNLGFIHSCNMGAVEAKGSFLVFLNNDTEVREGWLDYLVFTLCNIPNAGLVGSKLLYPDGHLQEAGVIVWKDGSCWNYGRFDDPLRPEYNYLRDVDYCTGASIMISKKLFQELNGFDTHYSPAYGEDLDLAFRVRGAGYRVLYQPLSEVIHFEGITSGKDVSSGVKSHQIENVRKFFDRWKIKLGENGAPGKLPELAKDRNICARMLVLDHCTPEPDQDAGSIIAMNMMRIFQSFGFKVTFIPEDNFLYDAKYTKMLQKEGIECLYGPYISSVKKHIKKFGNYYDVVLISRYTTGCRNIDSIRKYCRRSKVIFCTCDLHYLRELRQAEVLQDSAMRKQAEKTKKKEIEIIQKVDATIVHNTLEKRLLENELEKPLADRLFYFPWAITVSGTNETFESRNGMVFIGGYQHPPNVDAVIYFVKDIFPLIRKRIPAAKFYIVGSKAPDILRKLSGDGVEFLGFIEDLGTILHKCRLSVIPIRYGAGIKGKICTCMSYGLPCVSTSSGVEGMGLSIGKDILVEDEPEKFADAVQALHEGKALWLKISESSIAFVQNNFSFQAGRKVFKNVLESMGVKINYYDRPVVVLDEKCISANCKSEKLLLENQEMQIKDKESYDKFLESEIAATQRDVEADIVNEYGFIEEYHVSGNCDVCRKNVLFRVNRQYGIERDDGRYEPNWREHFVCNSCSLNTRQRKIASKICQFIEKKKKQDIRIYLMEAISPMYKMLTKKFPYVQWVGSEYLGDSFESGIIVGDLLHQNIENLSFENEFFDAVVSNDVFEHVNSPENAILEAYRVLKRNSEFYVTVPFHHTLHKSVKRSQVVNGNVIHYLPKMFHGNPMSMKGSLVFTDFGWNFLDSLREVGFMNVTLNLYWNQKHGYYGVGQHYIHAIKT